MDISSAIAGLTHATTVIRSVLEAGKKLEQAELKLRIAEITDALADAKLALTDAATRIADLESQLSSKSVNEERIKNLQKSGEFYFDGNVVVGNAKCPNCVESHNKIIGLCIEPFDHGILNCPSCKNTYNNIFFNQNNSPIQVNTDFDVFDT